MRKRFVALIVFLWLILIGVAILLASGALTRAARIQDAKPRHKNGKEVVTLWVGVTLDSWDEKGYRKAIRDFNAASREIYIDATLLPASTFRAKINIALATGQPPDVSPNAVSYMQSLMQKQQITNLAAPIPEEMIGPAEREAWGPAVVNALNFNGRKFLFPNSVYLSYGFMTADREWFEKAGVDLRQVLEQGWDYEEFLDAMRKVQSLLTQAHGLDASAFGANLKIIDPILYQTLLPQALGKEFFSEGYLVFDPGAGRYIINPRFTPEKLAQPLDLMRRMIRVDKVWKIRTLGMDWAQVLKEMSEKHMVAASFAYTPGDAIYNEIASRRDREKGLAKTVLRATTLPAPVPRKGMKAVHSLQCMGWGVLRQIPDKGDAHTRRALEVAKYMASPPVLAALYRESKFSRLAWPDPKAVAALTRDVEDPVKKDPWLSYLWDLYLRWTKDETVIIVRPAAIEERRRKTAEAVGLLVAPGYETGYFATEGHQFYEAVLYGKLTPEEGARRIIEGARAVLDKYYRRHPEAIEKPAPAAAGVSRP